MTAPNTSPVYDAVIAGAGPPGLSAALQLARSNRQVVVIDSGAGRSTYRQVNHNYLGFPGGSPRGSSANWLASRCPSTRWRSWMNRPSP